MAVLGCCAVSLTGCGHSATPAQTSSTATTTNMNADSLIVSLDDVRRIAGVAALTDASRPAVQPKHFTSDAPGPCASVSDQQAIFDDHWTQFRSVAYSGDSYSGVGDVKIRAVADVVQSVGVYPTNDAARATFDRLVPDLKACPGLHARNYDFTVQQPDASTVVLEFPGRSPWKTAYRVKSSVLVNVAALGFSQAEQTAETVLQNITDRIK
ncbi:sensor domain-containing protein [Mycobacterium rhizamassiliense]|nr:sensor domain-containing protein [Mycobacterium rhizamassiliense]